MNCLNFDLHCPHLVMIPLIKEKDSLQKENRCIKDLNDRILVLSKLKALAVDNKKWLKWEN